MRKILKIQDGNKFNPYQTKSNVSGSVPLTEDGVDTSTQMIMRIVANRATPINSKLSAGAIKLLDVTAPDSLKLPTSLPDLTTNKPLEQKEKKSIFTKDGIAGVGYGQIFSAVNAGLDTFVKKSDHETAANTVLDQASNLASNFGPWGIAAAGVMKGINVVDRLSAKNAKSQATAGETTTGYNLDYNTNAGSSYGGLFGNKGRKASDKLTKSYDSMNISKMFNSRTSEQNKLAAENSSGNIYSKNMQRLSGGVNTNILAAKNGMKLEYLSNIKNILKARNDTKIITTFEEPIEKFESGGKINVIPEGALHAHKHDLPEEISEQVTNKGIPVITMEDGGEITQHAEIERNEIVFNIDFSKKIEELTKNYNDSVDSEEKDTIALELGKLMTLEILTNTEDKTGLLDTIE